MALSRVDPWGGPVSCNEKEDCIILNGLGDRIARTGCFPFAGIIPRNETGTSEGNTTSICMCIAIEGGLLGKDCSEYSWVTFTSILFYVISAVCCLYFLWVAFNVIRTSGSKTDSKGVSSSKCGIVHGSAGLSLALTSTSHFILLLEAIGRFEQFTVVDHLGFVTREDFLNVLFRIASSVTLSALVQVSFTWLASVRSTSTVSRKRIAVLKKAVIAGALCLVLVMIVGFIYNSILVYIYGVIVVVISSFYVYTGRMLTKLIRNVLRLSSTVTGHKEWMSATLTAVRNSCVEAVFGAIVLIIVTGLGIVFTFLPVYSLTAIDFADYASQVNRGGASCLIVWVAGIVTKFVRESQRLKHTSPLVSNTTTLSGPASPANKRGEDGALHSLGALAHSGRGQLFTIMSAGDEEGTVTEQVETTATISLA